MQLRLMWEFFVEQGLFAQWTGACQDSRFNNSGNFTQQILIATWTDEIVQTA